MMLFGSLVWAFIIGQIVSVIQHTNMAENSYQEKMDAILEMSKEYGFSNELRFRLQSYFQQLHVVRRTAFLQELVSKMNSGLAIEFVHIVHDSWLNNIWWLRKVSKSTFVVHLTLEFLPLLYCPRESIVTANRLYVLQRGLCIHGQRVLSRDMCWGTDMLLTQEHLRSHLTTMAISYVHEALESTMLRFPEERVVVRRAYRTLCVMRGVVWRARQIRAVQQQQRRASRAQTGESQHPLDILDRLCAGDLSRGEPAVAHSHTDVEEAVRQTRQRIEALQDELGSRLENLGLQVAGALDLVTDALDAKQRKGWGRIVGR